MASLSPISQRQLVQRAPGSWPAPPNPRTPFPNGWPIERSLGVSNWRSSGSNACSRAFPGQAESGSPHDANAARPGTRFRWVFSSPVRPRGDGNGPFRVAKRASENPFRWCDSYGRGDTPGCSGRTYATMRRRLPTLLTATLLHRPSAHALRVGARKQLRRGVLISVTCRSRTRWRDGDVAERDTRFAPPPLDVR